MKNDHDNDGVKRYDWNVYNNGVDVQFQDGEISLGPLTSFGLLNDPKHMAFVLSRYKFVAKMLNGVANVVEVGCGDAFGAPVVAQHVGKLDCVDWDIRHVEGNRRRLKKMKNVEFIHHDINNAPIHKRYSAAFWLDVLEHLDSAKEDQCLRNICDSLDDDGVLITGTPNKTAEAYQTKWSRDQHINLKTQKSLHELLAKSFRYNFAFGMNDEVLHTGFAPMCHYLLVISVGKKNAEKL